METTKTLGEIAEERAMKGQGILTPGNCQAWVRECYEKKFGYKFEEQHKGSAELARQSWAKTQYAIDPEAGSVIGDLLYKRGTIFNRAGHVGIRIKGNRVAENSTRHAGRIRRGIGIVSLADFGKVDLIVRLK